MLPVPRAIVCAVVLLASAAAMAGTFTGTVTTIAPSQPLAGMVVVAYDLAGSLRGTATTDATGLYVMVLPAGSYRVLAYDANGVYATAFDGGAESFETSPLIALDANATKRIDFALVRGGRLSGQVLAPDGSVVGNAVISAYNLSGTRRGFTNANAQGSYSIVLPPGQYKLVAFDESGRYAATFYRDASDFEAATAVSVTSNQTTNGVDFTLATAALVTGNAVDAATRLPLPSIFVYAYTEGGSLAASTVTDASGAFRFSLRAGRYRFVAGDPARTYANAFYPGRRSFAAADVIAVAAGQLLAGLQLELVRGGVLAGRVVDAAGVALAGITVAAYNLDGTVHNAVLTGADGRFEIVVAPGEVKLAAFDTALTFATAYSSGRTTFATADVIRPVAGQRLPLPDLVLARGGRIAGTITDGVTLQPLGGIVVEAYDAEGLLVARTTTGAGGSYALVVPGGAYRILAFDNQLRYATSYAGGATSFEATALRDVSATATATVNFALFRGVKVSGTVADASGHALTGIEISALDASGGHVGAATSSSGAFALVLPANSYRFVARDPAGRFATAEKALTVQDGQSPQLSFVLTGAARRRAARH